MKITNKQFTEEAKNYKGSKVTEFLNYIADKYGMDNDSVKDKYYKLKKEGKIMLNLDKKVEEEGVNKIVDIINEGKGKKATRAEKETASAIANKVVNETLGKTEKPIANAVKQATQPKVQPYKPPVESLLTVTELRSEKNFFVLDGDSVKIYDDTEHYITVKAQDLKLFAMANMELNKRLERMQL